MLERLNRGGHRIVDDVISSEVGGHLATVLISCAGIKSRDRGVFFGLGATPHGVVNMG